MKPIRGDNHGIARIELAGVGSFGWQVRMQCSGQKVSRFFSDRLHGNATASLQAARHWRDEKWAAWQEQQRPRVCQISIRNASGVVGVSRVMVKSGNGMIYHFWQATWCPAPGQRQSMKFSVKKYGDAVAYQLAIEARQAGVGNLFAEG